MHSMAFANDAPARPMQLILTCHDLAKVVNDSGQVDMLVLDFAKAFDTVAHKRLLGKLESYGIDGNLYGWIQSFLEGRTQRVVVDGETSGPASVKSGVPQGSVLGPLLFLIFINPISHGGGLKTAPPCEKLKYFFGHNRL